MEIAVRSSLDTLRTLYPVIANELSLQWNLLDEVRAIQLEMEIMAAFLNYADKDENRSELVKTCIEQVRDAKYDVEDIIDEFIYQFQKQKRSRYIGLLHRIIYFPKQCIIRHKIATKMQQFKRKVQLILEGGGRYNGWILQGASIPKIVRQQKYNVTLEDNKIVGIKDKVDSLVNLLVGGDSDWLVISVTGMGGLGKTTLVTKAYQNIIVQNSFDCRAYLSISQFSDMEELLRNLVKEFKIPVVDMGNMSCDTVLHKVHHFLKSRSYVAVLDDVWNIQVWEWLQHAFPRSGCRGRIMLTTRNEKIASSLGDGSCDFALQPLNFKDACDLFYKNAFCKRLCPPELKDLALKFVERCEGLPFAVLSIGKLLACTPDHRWKTIYNTLNWELTNNDTLKALNDIILLSFYDLPDYLKDCFLHLSIFQDRQIIHRKRLIRLWIAEGFVEKRDGSTPEEVAEGHLMELIERNMIQLVDTNEFGRVKTFRIHDITREIAIAKSKERRFSIIYRGEQEGSFNAKIRRMSICGRGESFQPDKSLNNLRSFHVFDKKMPSSSLHAMLLRFKWLRVLDLQDTAIESVPDKLTDLFLLQYLNLRGTNIKALPKSLEKLIYLQTLDVRGTQMEKLPSAILKLKKLRHLYFYRKHYTNGRPAHYYECFNYLLPIHVPNGICQLKDLHCLSLVEGNKEILGDLGCVTNLRRLGISMLRTDAGEELCNSLAKMTDLQNLTIRSIKENESIQLDSLSSLPLPLQKLGLYGRLGNMPQWLRPDSLKNLTHLRLHYSQLKEDMLSSLQRLPQLVFLALFQAYNGDKLSFGSGTFAKLKKLYLHALLQLSQVHIEEGAMESIEELNLINCRKLKMVPKGIEHLSLQKMYLADMPEELIERMRTDGQDCDRIQHIPYIKHAYKKNGERVFETLSWWTGCQNVHHR